MTPEALLSDAALICLIIFLAVFSLFFSHFVITGSFNFPQACKTIFSFLTFVLLDLLPVAILASTTFAVFSFTFITLLAWFSVVVGHDCSDIPHFESKLTKHAFKIFFLDMRLSVVVSLGISASIALLGFTYERCRIAKDFKRELGKRLAMEQVTANAQHMTRVRIKQLADVDASLTCLICVDRLTQPYTLAPCGHTFDLECLQAWFRSAHPSPADQLLALALDPHGALFTLRRKKFCPLCHAEVVACPMPAYALHALGMPPEEVERQPWKGLFIEFRGFEKKPAPSNVAV
ncbi:hypothetical protein C8R44DRAFT_973265 [Mycena epipterygia]|nr:hypothetical protein C8R44DRAFT_973265 [Mycena epipterygia]